MDSEAEAWCEKIRTRRPPAKANEPSGPEQITIYTIGFGGSVGSRAKKVLTNCASVVEGKRQYYHAPDAATLKAIFRAIADNLARLRLTK
jgi:hypothetical protein